MDTEDINFTEQKPDRLHHGLVIRSNNTHVKSRGSGGLLRSDFTCTVVSFLLIQQMRKAVELPPEIEESRPQELISASGACWLELAKSIKMRIISGVSQGIKEI